jgi:hypothetical protein
MHPADCVERTALAPPPDVSIKKNHSSGDFAPGIDERVIHNERARGAAGLGETAMNKIGVPNDGWLRGDGACVTS